jgi:hypothetical protein
MLSAAFEPVIPANKKPQIYALERKATGIGEHFHWMSNINSTPNLLISISDLIHINQFHN